MVTNSKKIEIYTNSSTDLLLLDKKIGLNMSDFENPFIFDQTFYEILL